MSLAKQNIDNIPLKYKELYPECSTAIKETNLQLQNIAADGVQTMIERISKNKGKLSQKDKEYLNELILISDDTYWLEIIKKKEK